MTSSKRMNRGMVVLSTSFKPTVWTSSCSPSSLLLLWIQSLSFSTHFLPQMEYYLIICDVNQLLYSVAANKNPFSCTTFITKDARSRKISARNGEINAFKQKESAIKWRSYSNMLQLHNKPKLKRSTWKIQLIVFLDKPESFFCFPKTKQ